MNHNLHTSIQAMNSTPRKAAYAIARAVDGNEELTEVIETALADLVGEVHRLKDAWAAVMVDKDRSVRAASERALDCDEHGKVIADLEKQADAFSKEAHKNDKARRALLSGITAFDDLVTAIDSGARPIGELDTLIDAIRGVLKKVHVAHSRACSK
jgi:hypothetical protein